MNRLFSSERHRKVSLRMKLDCSLIEERAMVLK